MQIATKYIPLWVGLILVSACNDLQPPSTDRGELPLGHSKQLTSADLEGNVAPLLSITGITEKQSTAGTTLFWNLTIDQPAPIKEQLVNRLVVFPIIEGISLAEPQPTLTPVGPLEWKFKATPLSLGKGAIRLIIRDLAFCGQNPEIAAHCTNTTTRLGESDGEAVLTFESLSDGHLEALTAANNQGFSGKTIDDIIGRSSDSAYSCNKTQYVEGKGREEVDDTLAKAADLDNMVTAEEYNKIIDAYLEIQRNKDCEKANNIELPRVQGTPVRPPQ